MKIIKIDNFNRESVSDILIAESVSKYYGKVIEEYLNERYSGNNSPVFFRCVDDDYKLYKFEP